jgi:hypothetical protein
MAHPICHIGRGFPIRPHLAPPIVGAAIAAQVVTRPYVVSAVRASAERYRRPMPVVRLARPIIGAATVPPVVTRAFIVSAVAKTAAKYNTPRGRLKLANPIVSQPSAPVVTRPYIVSAVSKNAARYARGIWPRAMVADPVVGAAVLSSVDGIIRADWQTSVLRVQGKSPVCRVDQQTPVLRIQQDE